MVLKAMHKYCCIFRAGGDISILLFNQFEAQKHKKNKIF